MKKICIFLPILFICCEMNAQFNDSTAHLVKISSGGSINKTKAGSNYLFNNNLQFNVLKKRTALNSSASWLYGLNPANLTNNDFTLTSNVNLYRHFPEFYYWGLVNYTTSYSLNIKAQGQAGLGIAYNFINQSNLWLNVSNGMIGETSRIIQADTAVITYQTIRNSLRVQFMIKWNDRLSFRTGNFFQPSLEFISDHIISSDSEFTYQLWKGLNFNTRLTYNKISRTAKENLIFTYGFSYQKYF